MNVWNPHNYLMHSGTKGMHWHERRYQNPDGTWTELGKERRRIGRQVKKNGGLTGRSHGVDYIALNSNPNRQMAENIAMNQGRLARQYDEEEMAIQRRTYSQPPSQSVINVANQLGIKCKTRQMSMLEDRAAVNPNYTSGNDDGYSNNCVGCSLAYVLRRKGLDVNATYIENGLTFSQQEEIIDNYNDFKTFDVKSAYDRQENVNYDTKGHKKSMTDLMEDRIKSEFQNDLNSPHYGLMRVTRPRGAGHMMAWEYDPQSGSIIFIEAQANSNAMIEIERAGTGQTNRDIAFLVDPKVNMDKFSTFGEAGNGNYNKEFVNRNSTSLQIKGMDDDKYKYYYKDQKWRDIQSEEKGKIREQVTKQLEQEYEKSRDEFTERNNRRLQNDIDDAIDKWLKSDESSELYDEYLYGDSSKYIYYKERDKLRGSIDERNRMIREAQTYDDNDFTDYKAFNSFINSTSNYSDAHIKRSEKYFRRGV